MPKLQISKADLLAGQPSTPGWYKATLLAIPMEPSAAKTSFNFVAKFKLESNEKEIKVWFNTQAISNIVPLVEAITGEKVQADASGNFEMDTDTLVGKKVQIHIVNDTYNGRIVDKIDNYALYDMNLEGPQF